MYSYSVTLVRENNEIPFWYDHIDLSNNSIYQNLKNQFIADGKLINEEISYQNDNIVYTRTLNFNTLESCSSFIDAFFSAWPTYRSEFANYLTSSNHIGFTSLNQDLLPKA